MTNSEIDCRAEAEPGEFSSRVPTRAGGFAASDGWALVDELRCIERRGAVARVAAIIAHAVGTPLNVISGRAALICAQTGASDAIVSDATCIVNKVEELARSLRNYVDVLSCSELPTAILSASEAMDVRLVLVEALDLYEPVARFRNIALCFGGCPGMVGSVSRGTLLVVLTSLLSYAIRGTPSGGTIDVAIDIPAARPVELPDAEYVRIVLTASGCAFFNTKSLERCELSALRDSAVVEGMQVSMVCSALSRTSGGKIEIDDRGEGNGRVTVYWPLLDGQDRT